MNWNNLKMTAAINAYCAVNIPLLAFVTPKVIELTESTAKVRIRLDRRSRNHLRVMYFGALAMGAELSIALKALEAIRLSGKKIDFIFKDFKAEFLKRADGHVLFCCDEAALVNDLIVKASESQDRLSQTFKGYALVDGQAEPIMTYELTLSVRKRSKD